MRETKWIVLAMAAALAAEASAEMCVSRWSADDKGPHPATVKVSDAEDGDVITADLSALPKDAKVYRARLCVGGFDLDLREPARPPRKPETAMGGAEVYVLKAPYAAGKTPQLEAKPLPINPPWYDSLDVTEVVRQWAGGKAGNFGLYVRNLPNWDKDRTCIEIAYEGKAEKLPAQVAAQAVLHRAGQTFITWKDPEDAFGDKPVTWARIRDYLRSDGGERQVRYRVYRHAKPIDAKTITEATLLAEVKPLSGFNVNGWSMERLINQTIFSNEDRGELGKYGAFEGWNMWSPQGGKLVIRRFAIEDDKALPPGTGLYVHSPPAAERAYYAVTAVVDGVENAAQFSPANSLAQAADEKPGKGEPVRQPGDGKDFGFDFRGQRQFYVQWASPPLTPRASAYFNWSVLLPGAALEKGFPPDRKLPVELYFHSPGMSYARPPVKFVENSIQIAPHDFPFSGWYGFNDAAGTLRSCRDGVVAAHTQKRIAAFLDWAKGRFPIDPTRIIGVGGDGAGLTALYQPEMFAYMLITGFQSDLLDAKSAGAYMAAWGPRSPDIKNEKGLAEWSWAEFDYLLTAAQMPRALPKDQPPPPPADAKAPGWKMELPFFVIRGVTWGHDPGYVRGRGKFLYALQATGHGQYAHWAWGGSLKPPAKYTGLWQDIDFTNTTPFPAIAYATADKEGEGDGNCNARYAWKDVQDRADGFEVSISGPPGAFDVTPRRCRNFKPAPGEKLSCTMKIVPADPRSGSTTKPAERAAEVFADANGMVTVRGVELVRGAGWVTVSLSKTN